MPDYTKYSTEKLIPALKDLDLARTEIEREIYAPWLRDAVKAELTKMKDAILAEINRRVFWLACGGLKDDGEWFGLME